MLKPGLLMIPVSFKQLQEQASQAALQISQPQDTRFSSSIIKSMVGQLVRLHRAENFKILKSWPPRKFSPNWTHVIGGSNGLLLFYQEETGEGVTGGFIVGFTDGEAEFKDLKNYGLNFSDGWTHIVGL